VKRVKIILASLELSTTSTLKLTEDQRADAEDIKAAENYKM
jgi:hypothetical protein